MAERELSPEEVAALGLDAPRERELSAEEVAALGLDSPVTANPKAPGAMGSFVRGAAQGGTLGFADELGGAMQAGLQHIANGLPTGALEWAGIDNRYLQRPGEVYRQARDENRASDRAAQEAHSGAYLGGEVAGGLATLAAAPAGAGLSGAVKGGSMIGAGAGLGSSEADLTRGEYARAGIDTGLGMAGGASFAAGGYGAAKAAAWAKDKVLSRTAGAIDRATRDAGELAAKKASQTLNSENASLGGVSASAMKLFNHAKDILADPLAPAAQKLRAQELLNGPEGRAIIDAARESALEEAPRIVGRLNGRTELRDAAKAATSEGAIVSATDDLLAEPVKKQLMPRLATMASRAIPPIVASEIGSGIGGTEGRIGGAALGLGAAMVMGRPGTAMANAAKHPAVRKGTAEAIRWALVRAPEKLGKFFDPLHTAAAKSPQEFAVTHFVMQQQNPAYRQMLLTLDPDSDNQGQPERELSLR